MKIMHTMHIVIFTIGRIWAKIITRSLTGELRLWRDLNEEL